MYESNATVTTSRFDMNGRDDARNRPISIGVLGSGEGVCAGNSNEVHLFDHWDVFSALDTNSCSEDKEDCNK